MDLIKLMNDVRSGTISPEEAALKLRKDPFEDLGYAKIDHHRILRQGAAEVVYGAGKTPEQLLGIVRSIKKDTDCVLVTRIDDDGADYLIKNETDTIYHKNAKVCIIGKMPIPPGNGFIAVVTGGTSDIPVAEEAALTSEALGNKVERVYDVGVAGLHRLIANLDIIMGAKVVIAVAGMEGALVSVVGGLVDVPVIAVPTSVGYGASFEGVSALLSMLNSCASGVSVVNIDNGFGAGYLASMINQIGERQ
ncbi:MAG: nickel pincer cofactor biosynthesis protein LarB [Candidatus Methanogranum gryphiswaldense]|nr:MAG: nickel pincer cofactor biosynthesis protein LarB [Candidatus Methanogranum sp. U3.2.1]